MEGDGTHLQTLELKIHYFNFYCFSQTLALRKVPAYDLSHVLQILGERVMTSEPQSPDAPDVTHNNLILEQIEMILKADYSKLLPTNWEGVEGEIADAINQISKSRDLFNRGLLSAFQEIGRSEAIETPFNTQIFPGRLGDLAEGLNEMIGSLVSQLQGVAVIARGEEVSRLRGGSTLNSVGNFVNSKKNISSMLFVLQQSVLARAMTSRLTSIIADFSENPEQGRGIAAVAHSIILEMAEQIGAVQARFYNRRSLGGETQFILTTSFSADGRLIESEKGEPSDLIIVEAAEKRDLVFITNPPLARYPTPPDFGDGQPWCIAVLPIIFNNQVQAIIEFAVKRQYTTSELEFLAYSSVIIGVAVNNTNLHLESERLLAKANRRTRELEIEREKLGHFNRELERQFVELQKQRNRVEKNRGELEVKARELEQSLKYRSQFFSKMSHELRTPITSLLILTELLTENPRGHLDASELEFTKMIHSSSEDLLALINDILDLSKIEAGIISLDMAQISFTEIRNREESTFRAVALKKGVVFKIILDTNLPSNVVTDQLRLRQIINNLLSNALKFTEQGEVSLRVELADSGWSANHVSLNEAKHVVMFTVKDSGVGIPSSSFVNIFELYNQGEPKIFNKFGGTGVGLSISHEIAQMMGGELRLIQSEVNQGSTFSLFLPWMDALPSDRGVEDPSKIGETRVQLRSPDSLNRLVGKKVLVVEDDGNTASSICAVLASLGMIAYSENNGLSAIAFLEEAADIELVFMDIMMPEMDGRETISQIVKSDKIKKFPIIVLTAQATESDRKLCIQLGASDYTSKPISKDRLLALVQRWLP